MTTGTVASRITWNTVIRRLANFVMSNKLDQIPEVDIDVGKFKYVLMKVHDPSDSGNENSRTLVRGYTWAAYHCDIYEKVREDIEKNELDCECVGGGRILHQPDSKKIKIYGYSQGYGLADHSVSCDLVKKKYPDYEVTWSNDGY